PPATPLYTLSLHDALPICTDRRDRCPDSGDARDPECQRLRTYRCRHLRPVERPRAGMIADCSGQTLEDQRRLNTVSSAEASASRSEEHTSELQSRENLVCR